MAKKIVKENAEAVTAAAKTVAKGAEVVKEVADVAVAKSKARKTLKKATEDGVITESEQTEINEANNKVTKEIADVVKAKSELKENFEEAKKEVKEAYEVDKEASKSLFAKIKAFFKKLFKKA